jgi:hypothetical protein
MNKPLSWRKPVCLLATAALLFCFSQQCLAEEYSDCRSRCTNEYTDCMNQPQSDEQEVQTAKEANCSEKVQLCYADCENLRPPDSDSNDNAVPEANPNIIVR